MSFFFLQRGKGSLSQTKGSNQPALRGSKATKTVSACGNQPQRRLNQGNTSGFRIKFKEL